MRFKVVLVRSGQVVLETACLSTALKELKEAELKTFQQHWLKVGSRRLYLDALVDVENAQFDKLDARLEYLAYKYMLKNT